MFGVFVAPGCELTLLVTAEIESGEANVADGKLLRGCIIVRPCRSMYSSSNYYSLG